MFAYIRGRLASNSPNTCVIDVHGIGYLLHIPANAYGRLPQINEELTLHCSFIVRDTTQALFGFLTSQERDLFELLITISGVGPKLGQSIIGHLTLIDFRQAIVARDLARLSKIPGVGKKTAERLVIELRDKLEGFLSYDSQEHIPQITATQTVRDAMSALINLGYSQNTAQKAIKKALEGMPQDPDLAELITSGLNNV